jgi:prophage maintenance system killer protein
VAFQAMYLFLALNGPRIDASEEEESPLIPTLLFWAGG